MSHRTLTLPVLAATLWEAIGFAVAIRSLILSIKVAIQTSATVGDRVWAIQVSDSNSEVKLVMPAPAFLPASNFVIWTMAFGLDTLEIVTTEGDTNRMFVSQLPAGLVFENGDVIRVIDLNVIDTAGDAITNVVTVLKVIDEGE